MKISVATALSQFAGSGSKAARMCGALSSKTSILSPPKDPGQAFQGLGGIVWLSTIPVVLVLTGASTALGQQVGTDIKSMGLTGPVREIKESVEYPRLIGEGNSRV